MNLDITLESLIPFENLFSDLNNVLHTVDSKGQVIILKDNKPAYVIVSFKEGLNLPFNTLNKKKSQYTLHEAMKIVLLEKESKKMHAAELSEEIFKRGLYYKKDGGKARYNQIRARANNYPDLFITLEKNYIKLVEE
jgi:antitoxin Phd